MASINISSWSKRGHTFGSKEREFYTLCPAYLRFIEKKSPKNLFTVFPPLNQVNVITKKCASSLKPFLSIHLRFNMPKNEINPYVCLCCSVNVLWNLKKNPITFQPSKKERSWEKMKRSRTKSHHRTIANKLLCHRKKLLILSFFENVPFYLLFPQLHSHCSNFCCLHQFCSLTPISHVCNLLSLICCFGTNLLCGWALRVCPLIPFSMTPKQPFPIWRYRRVMVSRELPVFDDTWAFQIFVLVEGPSAGALFWWTLLLKLGLFPEFNTRSMVTAGRVWTQCSSQPSMDISRSLRTMKTRFIVKRLQTKKGGWLESTLAECFQDGGPSRML